jgi:hypothetical protein
MEAKSMKKLMEAGYTFVRPDDSPNARIKYKKQDSGDWKTLEKFDTKVARDKRLKQLLDLQFIIMD